MCASHCISRTGNVLFIETVKAPILQMIGHLLTLRIQDVDIMLSCMRCDS